MLLHSLCSVLKTLCKHVSMKRRNQKKENAGKCPEGPFFYSLICFKFFIPGRKVTSNRKNPYPLSSHYLHVHKIVILYVHYTMLCISCIIFLLFSVSNCFVSLLIDVVSLEWWCDIKLKSYRINFFDYYSDWIKSMDFPT